MFLEVFAGYGVLTATLKGCGLPTLPPDEYFLGGTDFSDRREVQKLRDWLEALVGKAREIERQHFQETGEVLWLFIHLAPPCATFSKARDRSWRTRVRSWAQPAGIKPVSAKVRKANIIAKQAILFARWAAETLGATVTLEHPDFSYIWIYGAPYFGSHTKYRDARMSYCMYGKAYKKNTRFRTWNGDFSKLSRLCTTKKGRHSCGNEYHAHLEFGGTPYL